MASRRSWARLGFTRFMGVLVLAAVLPACGTSSDDGDGDGGGGGNARLAESLNVDIANATAIAYVRSGGQLTAGRIEGLSDTDDRHTREGIDGLYIFTEDGEAVPVELSESGSDAPGGGVAQIYTTKDWIFLWAWGYEGASPDDPTITVPCNTVAIRRADGRLFCSEIVTNQLLEPSDFAVQQNEDGTMGVTTSRDAVGNTILYRLEFDPELGPIATLIDEFVYARTFVLNADGDALVTYKTSPLENSLRTLIWPGAMPPATEVSGTNNTFLAAGEPGAIDENTFYIASGGNGMPSDNVLRRVRKTADGFVEDQFDLTFPPESGGYGGLFRLANGTYMFGTNGSIVRVVADGEVLPGETPIPIEGIDSVVLSGAFGAYAAGDGIITIFARVGDSFVFVRHDGLTQVTLPVPDELSIQRVSFGPSGVVDFIARDLTTSEFVRGRFAGGSTELVVTPSDLLRPDDVVAFTALN